MTNKILKDRSPKQLQVGDFVFGQMVTAIEKKKNLRPGDFSRVTFANNVTITIRDNDDVNVNIDIDYLDFERPMSKFRSFGTVEQRATYGVLKK